MFCLHVCFLLFLTIHIVVKFVARARMTRQENLFGGDDSDSFNSSLLANLFGPSRLRANGSG